MPWPAPSSHFPISQSLSEECVTNACSWHSSGRSVHLPGKETQECQDLKSNRLFRQRSWVRSRPDLVATWLVGQLFHGQLADANVGRRMELDCCSSPGDSKTRERKEFPMTASLLHDRLTMTNHDKPSCCNTEPRCPAWNRNPP